MSLVDNASSALVSGRIPSPLVRGAAHVVVAILNAKMRIDDAKGSRRAMCLEIACRVHFGTSICSYA